MNPLTAPWSLVEVRQLVDAPRDTVFNTLADPRTYPDWLVGAQRIRAVDRDFPAPDSEFHHSVGPTSDLTVDDSTVAVEVHGHRKLVLEVHAGPLKGEVEFDLVRRGDDQTEVIMRERPIGAALALTPLLRPVIGMRNRKSMQQFARVAENRSEP